MTDVKKPPAQKSRGGKPEEVPLGDTCLEEPERQNL